MLRLIFVFSALLLVSAGLAPAQDNILSGDFESGTTSYNPWAGVDDQGTITVFTGSQLAVDDNGQVNEQPFGPSVAVGDLNGDGLPDLVVADARGYFWYFPNSGKPNAPVFTHGEIIPIWLGGGEFEGDVVPRMQLVDYTGEKRLSIVAGNFFGGLYYIHNTGSASTPVFKMPDTREALQVPTYTGGRLWCNYLSPFLHDWFGAGRLDLLMGDGSYSANSIYLFTNQGTNDRPVFNEKFRNKIIPGMGREDLTPQVVDWAGNGKNDVIAGERAGYIDLYLNTAPNKASPPAFDKDHPIHVTFDSTDNVGTSPTVTTAHLRSGKLFDLVVGTSSDGHVSVASNVGTADAPKFGTLTPLKGTNQYPKIIVPDNWVLARHRPQGLAYQLLEITNATVEKGFVPPPAPFTGKGALKFSMVQPGNVYFKEPFQPKDVDHYIDYTHDATMEAGSHYRLKMWVRADGDISNITWHVRGGQSSGDQSNYTERDGSRTSASSSWSQMEQEIIIPKLFKVVGGQEEKTGGNFSIIFQGTGTLYLDDISVTKVGK